MYALHVFKHRLMKYIFELYKSHKIRNIHQETIVLPSYVEPTWS